MSAPKSARRFAAPSTPTGSRLWGPELDAFEREFADYLGVPQAAALHSGTAALHLALRLAGVEAGDVVIAPTFTFIATISPILYLSAQPLLVDSEPRSWNIDPSQVERAIHDVIARTGRPPRAVIAVHLYGQCADMDPLIALCRDHGITLIEDAAEALGATYRDRPAGALGEFGIFSFNGNKIITTSGGGMLVARDPAHVARARYLATQARDPHHPHQYLHHDLGYNYRLSNLLAAVGRAQLTQIDRKVEKRQCISDSYASSLAAIPGVQIAPRAPHSTHTRWLTCLTIDPSIASPDHVIAHLDARNIEARRLWRPMHTQPALADVEFLGGEVATDLFDRGVCLPSSSALSEHDLDRVLSALHEVVA